MRHAIITITLFLSSMAAFGQSKQAEAIDFTQPILEMNGKPVLSNPQDLKSSAVTLGSIVATVLVSPQQGEVNGPESLKRDALATRLMDCKSCTVSHEESATITTRMAKIPGYPPHIYAQVLKILDPSEYERQLKP